MGFQRMWGLRELMRWLGFEGAEDKTNGRSGRVPEVSDEESEECSDVPIHAPLSRSRDELIKLFEEGKSRTDVNRSVLWPQAGNVSSCLTRSGRT